MASKFRNLIASKLRQQAIAVNSPNNNKKLSLRDLEAKMRLEASPNPCQPFRICLPRDFLIMPPELIEGFTTDDFIPSIVSLEKTTTRAKSSTSKTQNVLAFDLPHNTYKYSITFNHIYFL